MNVGVCVVYVYQCACTHKGNCCVCSVHNIKNQFCSIGWISKLIMWNLKIVYLLLFVYKPNNSIPWRMCEQTSEEKRFSTFKMCFMKFYRCVEAFATYSSTTAVSYWQWKLKLLPIKSATAPRKRESNSDFAVRNECVFHWRANDWKERKRWSVIVAWFINGNERKKKNNALYEEFIPFHTIHSSYTTAEFRLIRYDDNDDDQCVH